MRAWGKGWCVLCSVPQRGHEEVKRCHLDEVEASWGRCEVTGSSLMHVDPANATTFIPPPPPCSTPTYVLSACVLVYMERAYFTQHRLINNYPEYSTK